MSAETRRARPWLGTIVDIRVRGLGERHALRAIDAAFDEVAAIHALMSFHDPESELSRLNRCAVEISTPVGSRMREVLDLALTIARESDGRFDPTVAADLVDWGFLPVPRGDRPPEPGACWRDVRLDDDLVRFARPLWIDLGGIAKGYAVDRAIERLLREGATDACVNAGGDLRMIGPESEVVHLRLSGAASTSWLPAMELRDISVASSSGHLERRRRGARWIGPHVHGRLRQPVGVNSSVSVVAVRCAVADALTKVVLADRRFAKRFLPRYDATALTHDGRGGWRIVGSG
jgi:thiamine biosynthesis lipoprotein